MFAELFSGHTELFSLLTVIEKTTQSTIIPIGKPSVN